MDSKQEKQFLESYKAHTDALFRYCYLKVSDRELAKDLLQDVFMRAWQYIQKGHVVDNMKSFLYTTARNAVIDEYRKKKPTSLDNIRDKGFDVAFDDHSRVEDVIDGEHALALLSAIPEKYKDAIYMQYVEGLTIGEIAAITGESENNISVRIHRGLQKLREILREEEKNSLSPANDDFPASVPREAKT